MGGLCNRGQLKGNKTSQVQISGIRVTVSLALFPKDDRLYNNCVPLATVSPTISFSSPTHFPHLFLAS